MPIPDQKGEINKMLDALGSSSPVPADPEPDPAPAPEPEPKPDPDPKPAPEPEPKPEPKPAGGDKPPEPKPGEATKPEPKPEPKPGDKKPGEGEPPEPSGEPKPGEEDFSWRKQMSDMAAEQLGGGKKEPAPAQKKDGDGEPAPPAEPPKPAEPAVPVQQGKKFTITEDDWSKAMTDRGGMETLLNSVRESERIEYEARLEEVIRALPPIINNAVASIVDAKMAASDFYRVNEDLIPFKPLIQLTANKMSAKFPDKSPEELFNDVGLEVRKQLKMEKGSAPAAKKKESDSPAFLEGSSARHPEPPKLTGQKAEIQKMLKATHR